jgi:type IV pilus assembly protein PilB
VAVKLEEILVGERVIAADAAAEAAAIAEREGRSLPEILVADHGVGEDVVADLAARAINSLVIDVDLGALDGEAVRLIPEEDARRHLMVAVARGPKSLRVAFANPLDDQAIAAVREITGLEVDAMVATVSGLRKAIDREYEKRRTKVIRDRRRPSRGGSEMPEEVTQQTEVQAAARATPEQRHEALLLALVEAGVITRADYVAALERLLGE